MITRQELYEHVLQLIESQYSNILTVEINAHLMIMLCIEYDKLNYIPNFPTRVDTAKNNLKNLITNAGLNNDKIINAELQQILNLKFYEI